MNNVNQKRNKVDNIGLRALKLAWEEECLNELGKDKLIKILFEQLSVYRKVDSPKEAIDSSGLQEAKKDRVDSHSDNGFVTSPADIHSEIEEEMEKDYGK